MQGKLNFAINSVKAADTIKDTHGNIYDKPIFVFKGKEKNYVVNFKEEIKSLNSCVMSYNHKVYTVVKY